MLMPSLAAQGKQACSLGYLRCCWAQNDYTHFFGHLSHRACWQEFFLGTIGDDKITCLTLIPDEVV